MPLSPAGSESKVAGEAAAREVSCNTRFWRRALTCQYHKPAPTVVAVRRVVAIAPKLGILFQYVRRRFRMVGWYQRGNEECCGCGSGAVAFSRREWVVRVQRRMGLSCDA